MLTNERKRETWVSPALPAWAAPPTANGDAPHSKPEAPTPDELASAALQGIIRRSIGGTAVAIVLSLFGHHIGAIVLGVMLATSSIVLALRPTLAPVVDRATERFQRVVGQALSTVLLGAVHLVVFVPVSLILRLFRVDPLALGSSPGDSSFWRPAARSPKPLYHRPFAYERHPHAASRRVHGGDLLRKVSASLVLVAVLDLAAGEFLISGSSAPQRRNDFVLEVPDVGAAQDEPWAEWLFAELSRHYADYDYHPFRTRTMPDINGYYLNVYDGVRVSYQSSLLTGDPIEIYFFGGSAMMGWFQRDKHTIASEFVKLAEADGIAVRARNYGQPAYDNWQELLLLQEVLADGNVPDLTVFYDGVNEMTPQFTSPEPTEDPSHADARETQKRLGFSAIADRERNNRPPAYTALTETYADHSAVVDLFRRVRGTADDDGPAVVPFPYQKDHPDDRGEAAAAVYSKGLDVIDSLAAGYGFGTAYFWQPSLYTKLVAPGEREALSSWATHPDSWRDAYEAARDELPDTVTDLSDVLDMTDEAVMYDFVHTNEEGAEIVAQAMYDQLKPMLLQLLAARS